MYNFPRANLHRRDNARLLKMTKSGFAIVTRKQCKKKKKKHLSELLSKPALPAPPTSDDTDLQFWAEDEMSSSDSRLHLVCRQRRRHSLAYRNRVAIRKRSRSLLCQSSSSNSDPSVRMNIQSPIRHNGKLSQEYHKIL